MNQTLRLPEPVFGRTLRIRGAGTTLWRKTIEVLSFSENLQDAKAKMETWIKNGVPLAWLIDGDAETVYIYRRGHAVKTRRHLKELAGEGPVAGFVLNLTRIWEGL